MSRPAPTDPSPDTSTRSEDDEPVPVAPGAGTGSSPWSTGTGPAGSPPAPGAGELLPAAGRASAVFCQRLPVSPASARAGRSPGLPRQGQRGGVTADSGSGRCRECRRQHRRIRGR